MCVLVDLSNTKNNCRDIVSRSRCAWLRILVESDVVHAVEQKKRGAVCEECKCSDRI